MRPQRHHAKPNMTRSANRLAFTMWLNGCSDRALETGNPTSLGRSYGLESNFVAAEIAKETGKRRITKAMGEGQ